MALPTKLKSPSFYSLYFILSVIANELRNIINPGLFKPPKTTEVQTKYSVYSDMALKNNTGILYAFHFLLLDISTAVFQRELQNTG